MSRPLHRLSPIYLLLGLLLIAGATGCDEGPAPPEYTNVYDAESPGGPSRLDTPMAPSFNRATPTTVTLVWEDRSQLEDGYLVERAVLPSMTSFSDVRYISLARLPANTTQFTDTTLTGIDPYYYRLRAVRGALQSPESSALRVEWPGLTVKGFGAQGSCLSGLNVGVCTLYGIPYRISYPDALRMANLGSEAGRLSLNASRTRLLVASQRYAYPSEKAAYTVYNLATGQQEAQYVTPDMRFFFGNTSPMGFFVGEDEVLLYNGQELGRLFVLWKPSTNQFRPAPAFGPLTAAASATGMVFTNFDNTVVAFDAFTGQQQWTAPAQSFSLSPAGRYAFITGVNELSVLDSRTGTPLSTLPRRITIESPMPVQEQGFFAGASEDQPLLAISSSTGTLLFKNWQSKRTIRYLPGSNAPLNWDVAAFLPDGNALLARNHDQFVHLNFNAPWRAQ